MHLVTIPESLDKGTIGIFPAGTYMMEDQNGAEFMLQHPEAHITMVPPHWSRFTIPDSPASLCVAGGLGMGDAIMLTPVLRALKKKYPEAVLSVACFPHYRAPLLNLPYIDGFIDWPMPESNRTPTYFLEGFPRHELACEIHLTDVFAVMVGVALEDKKADYIPTNDEREWAFSTFPRIEARKRLGLQVQASHRCRTYPATQLRDLMQLMVKDGWEIYLMDSPGEFACKEMGHLHDLRIQAPSFRESAAFLLTCDAFCGPDSGFLHAAGAMNIPSVGLFATVPWKLRTAYYSSVFAMQGAGECSPCFHTPTQLMPAFPKLGPCAKTGKCEVLAGISPERIKAKIDQITSRP